MLCHAHLCRQSSVRIVIVPSHATRALHEQFNNCVRSHSYLTNHNIPSSPKRQLMGLVHGYYIIGKSLFRSSFVELVQNFPCLNFYSRERAHAVLFCPSRHPWSIGEVDHVTFLNVEWTFTFQSLTCTLHLGSLGLMCLSSSIFPSQRVLPLGYRSGLCWVDVGFPPTAWGGAAATRLNKDMNFGLLCRAMIDAGISVEPLASSSSFAL